MHEKVIARIDLNFPDESDELFKKEIKIGKDLSRVEVESAVISFLANTDFINTLSLYDYEPEINSDTINIWLQSCRTGYEDLTVEEPTSDDELHVGTFKSDHKYAGHAALFLVYERRYLENE